MSKKLIFALSLLTFSLCFHNASASIVINEVMYDLDGGDIDWVEVYNPDPGDVDLTTLKLLISNSTSNHSINNSSGSSTLHQGDYGVIVGSSVLTNYTGKWGTAGNIFTSSFSLPNDTGKVEINNGDKLNPMSTLTYDSAHGGSGNGKSLQKISNAWVESLPTPGKENVLSGSSGNDDHTTGGNPDTNTGTAGSGTGAQASATSVVAKNSAKIVTKVTVKNSAIFAGMYTQLKAEAIGIDGLPLFYGRYFWNFGDGDSKETKIRDGDTVSHVYFYPGEYTVTLEYYISDYGDVPDATNKLLINVLGADITISKTGNEKDFFIEISNNTDDDINMGKWMLISGEKRFVFPKNSFILSKDKTTFSPWITALTYSDRNDLKLVDQNWKTIFDYGQSITLPSPNTVLRKTTVTSSAPTPRNTNSVALPNGGS